jgi:hypothetical protein
MDGMGQPQGNGPAIRGRGAQACYCASSTPSAEMGSFPPRTR